MSCRNPRFFQNFYASCCQLEEKKASLTSKVDRCMLNPISLIISFKWNQQQNRGTCQNAPKGFVNKHLRRSQKQTVLRGWITVFTDSNALSLY